MSDTATSVAEIDDICGSQELAQIIIDVEKLFFWKRMLVHKHFLHKCTFVETNNSETDTINEKLKIIKKKVTFMKSTVKDIKVYSNKLVNTHIENGLSNVIDIQDKLKIEMKNKFETCKNLISNIDQKINVKYE